MYNSGYKNILFCSTFTALSIVACNNEKKVESKTSILPNIVLILADDLGYADLAVYGNGKVNTPNTTRLANEGIFFTDFHSNGANCAPTRAALFTGRYQQRTGVEKIGGILNEKEILIAEYLRNVGYKTGIFGKWHISGHLKSYEFFKEKTPVHYGFDEFKGFMSGFVDYQSHIDPSGNLDWWHNDQLVNEEGYSTHLLTNHAISFIEHNQNNPFFLCVSYAQIHFPWMTPDDPPYFEEGNTYDTAGDLLNSRLGPHDGSNNVQKTVQVMIEELDKGIGKIINAIERLDIAENTMVFFASDNGGYVYYKRGGQLHHFGQISSNFPFRGQKGTLYEGGHRVPAIAWWPGKISPGQKTDETTMTHDLFPTFLEIAGIDFPDSKDYNKIDGVSLLSLLTEGEMIPERNLFWALRDMRAVRQGDWKLVKNGEDSPELYNLRYDPGETNNLATYFTKQTDSLLNLLIYWESDVFSN